MALYYVFRNIMTISRNIMSHFRNLMPLKKSSDFEKKLVIRFRKLIQWLKEHYIPRTSTTALVVNLLFINHLVACWVIQSHIFIWTLYFVIIFYVKLNQNILPDWSSYFDIMFRNKINEIYNNKNKIKRNSVHRHCISR